MNDQDEESSQPFLQETHDIPLYNEKHIRWRVPHSLITAVAIISTTLSVLLLIYILLTPDTNTRREELTYPRFPTVQTRFTGGLKYDEHGELYLNIDGQAATAYIGNSSAADNAWRVFDAVQTVELDPAEVSVSGLHIDARGKAVTIPDVFHQLHCLNQIRTALHDPEYPDILHPKRRLHVEHCIDYLRQAIQCRADLTPLKLFYSKAAGRMMVDFEGMHTCRDFEAVLGWAWEHRFVGKGNVLHPD